MAHHAGADVEIALTDDTTSSLISHAAHTPSGLSSAKKLLFETRMQGNSGDGYSRIGFEATPSPAPTTTLASTTATSMTNTSPQRPPVALPRASSLPPGQHLSGPNPHVGVAITASILNPVGQPTGFVSTKRANISSAAPSEDEADQLKRVRTDLADNPADNSPNHDAPDSPTPDPSGETNQSSDEMTATAATTTVGSTKVKRKPPKRPPTRPPTGSVSSPPGNTDTTAPSTGATDLPPGAIMPPPRVPRIAMSPRQPLASGSSNSMTVQMTHSPRKDHATTRTRVSPTESPEKSTATNASAVPSTTAATQPPANASASNSSNAGGILEYLAPKTAVPQNPSTSANPNTSTTSHPSKPAARSLQPAANSPTPQSEDHTPMNTAESRAFILSELAKHKELMVDRFQQRERDLEEKFKERQKELERKLEDQTHELEKKAKELEESLRSRDARAREVIIDTQRKLALKTRKELEQQLHTKRMSIGRVVVIHDPMGTVSEMWEEGENVKDIQRRIAVLTAEREETEAARKRLANSQRRKTSKEKQLQAQQQSQQMDSERKNSIIDDEVYEAELMGLLDDVLTPQNITQTSMKVGPGSTASSKDSGWDFHSMEMDEIYKVRLSNIKRDLAMLQVQAEELELQKRQLVKTEKLFLDEAASDFANYPLINDRYLFLDMLGKGGFSEVFRAFDLNELKYVACKIHRLNPGWPEAAKLSYLKHVIRESSIQKELSHPRIVRLIDVFKINSSTLVTVLDLCEHGDLDVYLKEHDVLPEREARTIILQVFSGLRYLNEQKQRIIHYDLKPANILFHNGEVKITDFGLSKLVEEAKESIELTSQGAGTHWYLPPECFNTRQTPQISSAVDVWSCGVILFQMVFGRRPFPPGNTTMELFMAQLANSRKVHIEFPAKPQVSESTKDFIRRCLAYNPAERPDILTAVDDPYFRNFKG